MFVLFCFGLHPPNLKVTPGIPLRNYSWKCLEEHIGYLSQLHVRQMFYLHAITLALKKYYYLSF